MLPMLTLELQNLFPLSFQSSITAPKQASLVFKQQIVGSTAAGQRP